MRRDPDIAQAADNRDLAAVRGHLRRDRRCLDQLFDGRAALHTAAGYDRTGAIVAFLLAQGAAVDVVGFNGPGAQAPPGSRCMWCLQRWRPRWDSAALGSSARPHGERPAAAGREGLGGHQGQRRPGASANSTVGSPANALNSCRSMWHVWMT